MTGLEGGNNVTKNMRITLGLISWDQFTVNYKRTKNALMT